MIYKALSHPLSYLCHNASVIRHTGLQLCKENRSNVRSQVVSKGEEKASSEGCWSCKIFKKGGWVGLNKNVIAEICIKNGNLSLVCGIKY